MSRLAARDGPFPDSAAAAHTLDGVADCLAHWFGPFGCHALLSRALAHVLVGHPCLAALRVRASLIPVLDGVEEVEQGCGSAAATDGVTAVVVGVVDLVGGVIGDDITLQMLERHTPRPAERPLEPAGLAAGSGPVTRHTLPHAAAVDGLRGMSP